MKISRTHLGRIGKLVTLVACIGAIGATAGVSVSSGASFDSFGSATYPKIQGCPVNERFDNWDRFIRDGVGFSDFTENWVDLFQRNTCQQQDIISLQKAIEGTQNQLREKVFQCRSEGLAELSTKIHELQFELEYVRHVVDSDSERPGPDGTKGEVRQPGKILEHMRKNDLLKDGLIDSDRFEELFAETEKKYATRVAKYLDCKNADWTALQAKWNEFTTSWAGLKPAVKESAASAKKRVNIFLQSPTELTSRPLKGLLDIKVNGLTPEQNFAGVYKDLTRDARTGAPKRAPDYSTFLDRVESEHDRYVRDEDATKRKSYYEGLYRYTSDASGEEFKNELVKMNKVIQDTIQPVIDNVRACTALIAERQCGGK